MAVENTRDAAGAEMRIETGTGRIDQVVPKDRNVHVMILSDNRDLRDPITGWLDSYTVPAEMLDQLRAGQLNGRRVEYRVEVHRKPGVDPAVPLLELAPRQKIRELALIRLVDDAALNAGAPSTPAPPPPPAPEPPSGAGGEVTTDPADVVASDTVTPETVRLAAVRLVQLAADAAGSAGTLLPGTIEATRLTNAAAHLRAIADGLAA